MNRSRALHMKSAERRFIEANWSTPFLALILRSPLLQPKSTRGLGADSHPIDSMMPERGWLVLLCGSVHRRQANFGKQLLEGRVAVKAAETLVIDKIQHDLVMRLDADGQVLERFARVAEPSVGLRHKIG